MSTGAISSGKSDREVKLTNNLYLMQRSRMVELQAHFHSTIYLHGSVFN
jgi:hypothetical protein